MYIVRSDVLSNRTGGVLVHVQDAYTACVKATGACSHLGSQ